MVHYKYANSTCGMQYLYIYLVYLQEDSFQSLRGPRGVYVLFIMYIYIIHENVL